jgi:hypothetical protein
MPVFSNPQSEIRNCHLKAANPSLLSRVLITT